MALVFCLLCGAGPARSAQDGRIKLSIDIVESNKKVKYNPALAEIKQLSKRKGYGLNYLGGGEFTLPPNTEEVFLVRQDSSDLELRLSWKPSTSFGQERINLKYRINIKYPFQDYADIEKNVELAPGEPQVIYDADTPNGSRDTRPIFVLLRAVSHEPSYVFPVLGGIGVKLAVKSGYPFVAEVLAGTPAAENDFRIGDEVTEVNGYSTLQMTLENIMKLVRGNPGTKVKIKIFRREKSQYIEKELTRRIIE